MSSADTPPSTPPDTPPPRDSDTPPDTPPPRDHNNNAIRVMRHLERELNLSIVKSLEDTIELVVITMLAYREHFNVIFVEEGRSRSEKRWLQRHDELISLAQRIKLKLTTFKEAVAAQCQSASMRTFWRNFVDVWYLSIHDYGDISDKDFDEWKSHNCYNREDFLSWKRANSDKITRHLDTLAPMFLRVYMKTTEVKNILDGLEWHEHPHITIDM
jgi:hypothetical protein